jgi:hypothetical protein
LLTVRAFHQSVTEFVKNKLCKTVIVVEINRMGNGDGPLPIAGGIGRISSLDFEAQTFGALLPNKIQRVRVLMRDLALHGTIRVARG